MLLNDMSVGMSARLAGFTVNAQKHQSRYLSLGLIPGLTVQVVHVAPLGCPLQIKVGSTLLSIRKAEAAELHVEIAA